MFASLLLALALALSGCSTAAVSTIPVAPSMHSNETTIVPICQPFLGQTDELVACGRALGTLESLLNPNINWRLRYFFKYFQMPCGEAPTVEEAYAVHMAWDDINSDADLTPDEVTAIEQAMWSGIPDCSGG